MTNELKWHQKSSYTIALLILFFPLGAILWWKNKGWSLKTLLGIIVIITIVGVCNKGNNTACKCIEEFDTMNYNSALYIKCLDWAIAEGESDAYDYFKKECDK